MTVPESSRPARRPAGAWIFLAVLLLESLLTAYLILARRLPFSHDTFHYFNMQFYFLNNAAQTGEIAQWLPYSLNGTVGAWWFVIQAGFLQQVLLQAAFLFRGMDLRIPFYAGLWVDHLFLLAGTWLLSRRFFPSSLTRGFVALTVVGSSLWTSQPWLNLHSFSAVPLLLYLLHRFLETSRWRYVGLAGNLLAVQCLGNLPYILPMTTLVLSLYLLLYGLFHGSETRAFLGRLRWGPSAWTALAIGWISLAAVYFLIQCGVEQQMQYNIGRNPDGSTTLETFLHYGGNQSWSKWLELFLGFSPCRDYTLYLGLLGVTLALAGALRPPKEAWHFLLLTAILVAISQGTPVAALFYNLWPLMKYFRHLALVGGFIKLFLAFLAGFGFQNLFQSSDQGSIRVLRRWTVLGLFLLSLLLILGSQHPSSVARLIERMFTPHLYLLCRPFVSEPFLEHQLVFTACIAGMACLLLYALFRSAAESRPAFFLGLVLLLQTADLYGYRMIDLSIKTLVDSPDAPIFTRQQPAPYRVRRIPAVENPDSRVQAAFHRSILGEVSESLPLFLFLDEPASFFRTDYLQKPYDRFTRTYLGMPLIGEDLRMTVLLHLGLLHRMFRYPAAEKACGASEDKIQFFSAAAAVSSEQEASSSLIRNDYRGDVPILLPAAGPSGVPLPPLSSDLSLLPGDTRLALPYRIDRFDANHLNLSTEAPGDRPVWLYYSDVWHPAWKATVNGLPVPIFRANLAYKAIPLQPGINRVQFHFEVKRFTWLCRLLALMAAFWIGFVGWKTVEILTLRP